MASAMIIQMPILSLSEALKFLGPTWILGDELNIKVAFDAPREVTSDGLHLDILDPIWEDIACHSSENWSGEDCHVSYGLLSNILLG